MFQNPSECSPPPFTTDFGKNTVIGERVFMNSGCRFQDQGGITIGKGATIGAGSMVTRDVPPGDTWVGNPALPIRYRKGIIGLIKGLIYRFVDLF